MKKFVCMAMAAMMMAGSVSAFGAETYEENTLFTATVGTKDFLKNGVFQPLDVEIYMKDGYVMLPMRAFLTAVDEDAAMVWHPFQAAQAEINGHNAVFAMEDNLIHVDGKRIQVSGEMEIKEGRLFVPLRNWGDILRLCGYDTADIFWDGVSRTATVAVSRTKAVEGETAEFSMALTTEYDEIEPLGDGYFLAQKYVGEEDVGLGQGRSSAENVRYLLDEKGTVLQVYDTGTDNYMDNGNEGLFRVGRRSEEGFGNGLINRKGETVLPFVYNSVEPFYDGLAKVTGKVDGETYDGFVNTEGEIVIPLQYKMAESFSEGLAAVCTRDEGIWVDGWYQRHIEWGYIDKTGKLVIDGKYKRAEPFYEGLAKVRTEEGTGYIDKEGNEVIPCQYQWGGYFRNGVTYVTDDEEKTWLINKKGEKLKLIAEGKYVSYASDRERELDAVKNGILQMEQIVDLPDGDHTHVFTYYDETGEISYETMRIRKNLSEGLSPYHHSNLRKYGYVDENGKWVIAPAFDAAEPFKDGYAVVANAVYLEDGTEDVEWGILRHPNA